MGRPGGLQALARRLSRPAAPPPARGDLRAAALVALATLAAWLAANLVFVATYAVRGDDGALILHSTRFFPVSAADWVTRGFSGYFANFPEATGEYTAFVRPTVNLSFWLESWLAPSPNSGVFLATNYLGHALCAALVFLFARRIAETGTRRAVLAAALFAGSLAALELFHSAAFRGDMLGALFGMAAILSVDRHLRTRRTTSAAAAVLFLLLAVFAKETAVPAVAIAAAWALWGRGGEDAPPRRHRIVLALLLCLPLALFALARMGAPEGGVYVSPGRMHAHAAETLSSAFFPGGGAFELLGLLRGSAGGIEGARSALAILLNLVALALAAVAVLRGRDARVRWLAGMTIVALLVPALLAPYPRLMYFGQMFALPLFAALLPRGHGGRGRIVLAAMTVLALAVGPLYLLARVAAMQPELARLNRESRAVQAALVEGMRDPAVRRVYLVNDAVGGYGSLALMRIAAHRAGRDDVSLRVTNSMGRFDADGAPGEMRALERGGGLDVVQRCAAACDFSFPGVLPENRRRLGAPGVVRYQVLGERSLAFTIPGADRGDLLVVAFDPARGGVWTLGPPEWTWRRAPGGR